VLFSICFSNKLFSNNYLDSPSSYQMECFTWPSHCSTQYSRKLAMKQTLDQLENVTKLHMKPKSPTHFHHFGTNHVHCHC
jgi:hypothetical protein